MPYVHCGWLGSAAGATNNCIAPPTLPTASLAEVVLGSLRAEGFKAVQVDAASTLLRDNRDSLAVDERLLSPSCRLVSTAASLASGHLGELQRQSLNHRQM
jgi:hypothetical protein